MIFQETITTPAGTTSAAPLSTVMKIVKGVTYKIEVSFPFGCARLVGVRIKDRTHQIYPSTQGEWFLGHGTTIEYDDKYTKNAEPYEVEVETYNIDDTYDHTVQVRIGMAVTDDEIAALFPNRSVEALTTATLETVQAQDSGRRDFLKQALETAKAIGG